MAEVLITIGIIGVVAAMTRPALVAKYQKKVLHTQFLKAYSDLNNAALLFKAKEGLSVTQFSKSLGGETYYSTETLQRYMSYFKGAKNGTVVMFGDIHEETDTNKTYEDVFGFTPKILAGNYLKNLLPCDESASSEEIAGRLYVMDNNLSKIYANLNYGPKICVDINGRKGPNIYGYDWFVFVFLEEGPVKPYIGASITGYADDLANPAQGCSYTSSSAAYTCAYYALQDVSPLDPAKKYWTDFLK